MQNLIFKSIFGSPTKVTASPLGGWDIEEVLKTFKGAAENDIYGKLFFSVRDQIKKFISRLKSSDIEIEIHSFKAEDFNHKLEKNTSGCIFVYRCIYVVPIGTYLLRRGEALIHRPSLKPC